MPLSGGWTNLQHKADSTRATANTRKFSLRDKKKTNQPETYPERNIALDANMGKLLSSEICALSPWKCWKILGEPTMYNRWLGTTPQKL